MKYSRIPIYYADIGVDISTNEDSLREEEYLRLSNALSPKGYIHYDNATKEDTKGLYIYDTNYYKTLRKAAKDCKRPIGIAIIKGAYWPGEKVRKLHTKNDISVHVLPMDRRRLSDLITFVSDFLHLNVTPEEKAKAVRKAVFAAARACIF